MLKKLIKYDLIWMNKSMVIFFIISFIISVLTRVASYFDSSFIGNILYIVFKTCSIACISSTLINCVIRIWVRFRTNIYKDESYLTHTIPVSKNTLYDSKIISSFFTLLISLLSILLDFIIVFLDNTMLDKLKQIFSDGNNTFIFINILIIMVLELLHVAYCGIMGIIIGHKSNNNKVLKSILIGIGSYYIIQTFIYAIIFLLGLFNPDIKVLFSNNPNSNSNLNFESGVKSLVIIADIVYIAFITLMHLICKKIFNKGVNVE